MGIIRKATLGTFVGVAAAAGYVRASTTIISPIPQGNALWASSIYKRHNAHGNASTNDICARQVPLDKIRPELLNKDGALALELCRGVWSGWGYEIQRRYLWRKWHSPETASQLWSREQLASSDYTKGTAITDHFEVMERTPTAVTIRCGDSPRNSGGRASDGMFIISAEIDQARGVANLALTSCLFNTAQKVEGTHGPMPDWMETLHQWYARIWMVSASQRIMR